MKFFQTTLTFLLVLLSVSALTKTIFEDDFSGGMDNWTVWGPLDVEISTDNSAPAEYGPKVLSIPNLQGVLGGIYVNDLVVDDCILEVLWKDAALPEDADGILMARFDLELLEGAAGGNAWPQNGGYLMELDTDSGFHVNKMGGAEPMANEPGRMSTGEWNWIKWRLEGANHKLKTWDVGESEPDWMIEADDQESIESGGVGLEVWSGEATVAYFRVTDLDGPSAVCAKDKLSEIWSRIKTIAKY